MHTVTTPLLIRRVECLWFWSQSGFAYAGNNEIQAHNAHAYWPLDTLLNGALHTKPSG